MKKENRVTAICFSVTAFIFYICAIINFVDKESSMGVLYLCLGSTNLCLASVYLNKNKDNTKK